MMELKKTTKTFGENHARPKPLQKSQSSTAIGRPVFGNLENKDLRKLPLATKAGIINRENAIKKPLQKSVSTAVICRPALGEVGNKLLRDKKPDVVLLKKTVQEKFTKLELNPTKQAEKFHLDHKTLFARKDLKIKPVFPHEKEAVKAVSYSSNQLKGIIDVDENTTNPLLVGDYIKDIMTYLLSLEDQFQIKENYLLAGHESTARMRSVLLNWLVEVHDNFKLLDETLHLTVAVVDRYLQLNKNIGRGNLQLVGITALFIAAKYEEMYLPQLEDFVYVCDDTFPRNEILTMEINILKVLDFNLGRPLPLHFLRRYNKIAKASPQEHMVGKYLLELIIDEHCLGHINPSLQAAAACYFAKQVFNETEEAQNIWDETMVHYTTYALENVKKVAFELAVLVLRAPNHKYQATRTKFSTPQYKKISTSSKLFSPIISKFAMRAKILKV